MCHRHGWVLLMKNFVQPGSDITMIAPAGCGFSGQLVIVGAIFGRGRVQCRRRVPGGGRHRRASRSGQDSADALVARAVPKAVPARGVVSAAGTVPIGWVVRRVLLGAPEKRQDQTNQNAS